MDRYHTRFPFTELDDAAARDPAGADRSFCGEGMGHPGGVADQQIQEALTAWTIAHRPSHVVYRIVGEQWAPRSHELRDLLTRNSIPFEFYAADSEAGRAAHQGLRH